MKNILLQKQIVLLICIFALAFLVACQRTTPEVDTQEELLDYYKEIYGEDCITQLPNGEYARIHYDYTLSGFPNFKVTPLVDYTSRPEFYSGDLFTCYSDKKSYKPGEEIAITVEYHGSDLLDCGDTGLLEILVGGQWYPLNPAWYYPGTYGDLDTEIWGWVLTERYLSRVNTYVLNEETGQYDALSFIDREPVPLRPGHYRFRSSDICDEDTRYHVFCEFDVVE